MALNPYRPAGEQLQPQRARRWWLIPFWLGTFEILIGLTLGLASCGTMMASPVPGSGAQAFGVFALDVIGFVVPGLILQMFPRRWYGWIPQLTPALIVLYSLLSSLSG